ncbi:hypothetical protein AVME950_04555 [Acidovorax sp. SUPP950]|uniref:hypothetical protein n=1 Tax=Acidovorax sp. SUPP950 TaxID=511901 RepID=UPI0023C844B8|nr:hypothetical protein [Acidovorax sp. SUPP950]GKS74129.1 hypothetical protein AVME950_04555 [Acidovorax sp. SUPP950]
MGREGLVGVEGRDGLVGREGLEEPEELVELQELRELEELEEPQELSELRELDEPVGRIDVRCTPGWEAGALLRPSPNIFKPAGPGCCFRGEGAAAVACW